MLAFVVRRFAGMVVVLFTITTVVFFLSHASPFDPVRLILGRHYTPQSAARMRAMLELNKPVWRQYLDYMGGLLHGDLGRSISTSSFGEPVWDILSVGLPVTLQLGALALVVSLVIGLPLGLLSAARLNTPVDHSLQTATMILYALPSFVLAPVCQLIFGVRLRLLPVSGWGDPGILGLKEMVLPVLLFAAGMTAYFARSYRAFLLDAMQGEYIRTARAKGLGEWTVLLKQAARTALPPLASLIGPVAAFLVVGAFIVEYFFAIPGVGYITVQSVDNADFPVIQATTLLLAASVVVLNFLTDLFHAWADPRVRL